MTPPGWDDEENEDDAPWMDGVEDELVDEEELEAEDDEFLDDDEDEEFDDDAEEEDEDELEPMIEEGEALIEEGEYAEALELFREAAERFPESPLAAFHLGHTALMLFSDGFDENTPDAWKDDDDLESYFEEAMSAFDTALSLDAAYYPALNDQGALHMMTGNIDAAIECLERSLDANEDQDEIAEMVQQAKSQRGE